MNILTLNAGSATLKYKLFGMPEEHVLASGSLDHPGNEEIAQAAEAAIEKCRPFGVDVVGHRVVHGGSLFSEPTVVTADILSSLRTLKHLDPLHNPIETAMIASGLRLLPHVPAIAVFDTAFHRTMPETAWRYAIDYDIADRLSIRRYGFHGLSHEYVSVELLKCLGRPAEGSRLIVCHLGSGASICALRDGKSVDTSMGLTPMEGLVMGTRSGDVDPGLILYLLRSNGMGAKEIDDLLNDRSGLLGLSGSSADVRALQEAVGGGDARAELALEIFAYRVCKYIGAYAAALEGLDAVAFTGGVGENSADVRQRICRRLEFLGIRIDSHKNTNVPTGEDARISAEHAAVEAWVIPTDEELQITRNTVGALHDTQPREK